MNQSFHSFQAVHIGRGRRNRTLGTRIWSPLLYQLSYTPTVTITLYHRKEDLSRGKSKKFLETRKNVSRSSILCPKFAPYTHFRPSVESAFLVFTQVCAICCRLTWKIREKSSLKKQKNCDIMIVNLFWDALCPCADHSSPAVFGSVRKILRRGRENGAFP